MANSRTVSFVKLVGVEFLYFTWFSICTESSTLSLKLHCGPLDEEIFWAFGCIEKHGSTSKEKVDTLGS
jgi:hypothetical protein